MNAGEFNERLIAAAGRLRKAEDELESRIEAAAEAERVFEEERAKAMLQVEGFKNVAQQNAMVELWLTVLEGRPTVNALRYQDRLSSGLEVSARKAVDNRRQEMSALQSLMALAKAEAQFYSSAPPEVVGT